MTEQPEPPRGKRIVAYLDGTANQIGAGNLNWSTGGESNIIHDGMLKQMAAKARSGGAPTAG
jgi:hypothetical protein